LSIAGRPSTAEEGRVDAPAPAETTIRLADPADTDTVLSLIREKAENDGSSAMLDLDHGRLRSALSGPSPAVAALLAEQDGSAVGVAIFLRAFSTYLTRPALWLEDLFVRDTSRRQGVGSMLVAELCRVARAEGAVRVDWAVRVTNERAIELYASLGAELRDKFTLCRLDAGGVAALARPDRS
jgi:GNAT superfamily N-acetyltransferase